MVGRDFSLDVTNSRGIDIVYQGVISREDL